MRKASKTAAKRDGVSIEAWRHNNGVVENGGVSGMARWRRKWRHNENYISIARAHHGGNSRQKKQTQPAQ